MSFSFNLVWSEQALLDMKNIQDYLIENWPTFVCAEFMDKIEDKIFLVRDNPFQFQQLENAFPFRKVLITEHNTLYYNIYENEIEILRIFDTRQHPDKLTFAT